MIGTEVSTVATPRPAPTGAAFSPAELTDLLVRVSTSADRQAFTTLYGYFAPRVKGFLMRNGAPADLADDLAQETMVKVWRKAKLFDPAKAAAATWIFTIARNARIDAARRAAKPALDPDEPALMPEPEPTADVRLERADRDEKLRSAFNCLPDNQREVVELHFLEDAAHSEIAERLGVPLGTVKSRLRLAFEKIRKEVGDIDA